MELLYAELSHSVPCVSRQFATEKSFTSFVYFTSPQLFSRRHLPSLGQWSGRPCTWSLSAMLYPVSTLINVTASHIRFSYSVILTIVCNFDRKCARSVYPRIIAKHLTLPRKSNGLNKLLQFAVCKLRTSFSL